MIDSKPPNPPAADAEPVPSLGTDPEGHMPASESDPPVPADSASDKGGTRLPASEEEELASSDVGERILERGLTRLPPG
jgi:hypothetical protein